MAHLHILHCLIVISQKLFHEQRVINYFLHFLLVIYLILVSLVHTLVPDLHLMLSKREFLQVNVKILFLFIILKLELLHLLRVVLSVKRRLVSLLLRELEVVFNHLVIH